MKSLIHYVAISLFLSLIMNDAQASENGKQTWGYVEVRPGAHMFWWLYYTTYPVKGAEPQRPLVLWLQGGPGASSTGFGNFEEIGPLDSSLKNRTNNWVSYSNILFVDNPVGCGFSYVTNSSLLTTNNSQIATDLLEMFTKFLQKVPEFQSVPFYIFSESYGGKMAAQFALKLYKQIEKGKVKCNFKGVSLGDSWISPVDSVLTWGEFLYSTSMVDSKGYSLINGSAYGVKEALDKGQFKKGTALWDETEALIEKETNGVNVYNILQPVTAQLSKSSKSLRHVVGARHLSHFAPDPLSTLMNGVIKQMLRIIPANVTWGGQQQLVFDALAEDFMKPVTKVVENLLNNTNLQVNVYSGQLDMIVDTMGTIKWVEEMNWVGVEGWKKAERRAVVINGSTEMFLKSYKNFGFYWILKAGHMVPADAPETAVEMLQLITNLKPIK